MMINDKMSKLINLKLYSLEDFINTLDRIDEELEQYLKSKPGFNADYNSWYDNKYYYIDIYLTYDNED